MSIYPVIKARMIPQFPSKVIGTGPIGIGKDNGNWTIGFDLTNLMSTTSLGSPSNYETLIREIGTGRLTRANLSLLGGGGGGGGSVTSVAVGTANGFGGTVTNSTSNASIAIRTTVTGLLKGDGTGVSAAVSGTDFGPATAGLATGILKNTTSTGAHTIAVAADFPALNQNTTGSAASFTGSLVGDVTGTQGATVVGKVNGVAFSGLATGVLKNTTTTGVPSIAVAGTDYSAGTAGLATGILKSTTSTGNLTIAIPSTDYQSPVTLTTIGTTGAATFVGNTLNIPTPNVGAGDTSSNTSSSVDGEAALFSGTGGKTIKRATGTGIAKLTSGVLGTATAGTDFQAPISLTTSGTSGAATLVGTALNIPNYAGGGGGGGGDASTNTATSVDGEIAVFSATSGKLLKRATGSGIATVTSGVLGTVTAPSGTIVGTSDVQALTNKDLTAGSNTYPTFNQNTSGSAAKWTSARNLAGNSVDGSANVAFANKFIVQGTTDTGLSGAQFLGALGTGLLKNTTTTGVLSVGTDGTDYISPTTGGTVIHALTAKTTPVDADEFDLSDSAASFAWKKVTWANIKATLKAYFDALYSGVTRTVNAQTGTTYTLVIGDAGNIVTMNNAAANTLTIPQVSSVAWPVGTQIDLGQRGAGKTTVAAGTGVTVVNTNKSVAAQFAGLTLVHESTNSWVLYGTTIA